MGVVWWEGQELEVEDDAALPGLAQMKGLVRSVRTPEFAGMTFHEVAVRSVLNRVPASSSMPFRWTVNPFRGCRHACTYCYARATHRRRWRGSTWSGQPGPSGHLGGWGEHGARLPRAPAAGVREWYLRRHRLFTDR